MKSSSCHGRVKGSHLLNSRITLTGVVSLHLPAFCSASLSIKMFISGVASLCLLACVLHLWTSRWASLSEVASLCLLAWALCLRSSTWASLSGVVSLRLLACNPSRSTETTKSCLTVWQTNTNYYAVTQNSTTVRSLTLLLTSCIPLSAPRKSPLSLSLIRRFAIFTLSVPFSSSLKTSLPSLFSTSCSG